MTISLQSTDVISFAGDSITYQGIYPEAGTGWITQFQARATTACPGVQTVMQGVGGNTSSQLLARFPAILTATPKPTIVSIFIGINDIAETVAMTDANTVTSLWLSNVKNMVSQCFAAGIRLVGIVTPLCFGEKINGENAVDEYIEAVRQAAIDLVAATPNTYLVDLRGQWNAYEQLPHSNWPTPNVSPAQLTYDSVAAHPSAIGQDLICNTHCLTFGI